MKRQLLIFLFVLCAAITATAQHLVNNLDSVYLNDRSPNSQPTLRYAASNTFNADCLLDTANFTNFVQKTNQLESYTRMIYSYYPGSSQEYQSVFQKRSPAAGSSFANVSRRTTTYDAYGYTDSVITDNWDSTRWHPGFLLIYNHTPMGDETLYLQQQWSDVSNAYVNQFQYLKEYDEDGDQTYSSYQRWAPDVNRWYTEQSTLFIYDTSGYLVSQTDSVGDYANAPAAVSRTTYYNNSDGYTDSSYTYRYRDSSFTKANVTYYPNSNQYQYRYAYNYSADSTLLSTDLQKHYFDSSLNQTFDSTISSAAYGNNPQFFPTSSFFSRNVYSADSSILSVYTGMDFYQGGGLFYHSLDNYILFYVPCPSSALPVSLLSFTADKNNNNAVLQWKTSNETSTISFNVQRSTDGIRFTTIGNVKAAGNSSGERSYTYTDFNINTLGAGKLYYRLAQQDVNGATHNSAIARIDITNDKLSITLSPNPVRNSISIYSPVAMPGAVIRIADMSGKVVYTSCINLSAGTKSTIDASAFARGVYFVTIQSGTDKQVMKLVKE